MIPSLGFFFANRINTRIWLRKENDKRIIEIRFSFIMNEKEAIMEIGAYGIRIVDILYENYY
jgi:hypothetical protein